MVEKTKSPIRTPTIIGTDRRSVLQPEREQMGSLSTGPIVIIKRGQRVLQGALELSKITMQEASELVALVNHYQRLTAFMRGSTWLDDDVAVT